MKKLLTLVLMLMLLSCALADALPDFGTMGTAEKLPDVEKYSGTVGQLFEAGYAYNGAEYDAWRYGRPADVDAFLTAWRAALEQAGYAVSEGKEMDNDAIYFDNGEATGFLLYDYQQRMLLMVPVSYGYMAGEAQVDWDVPSLFSVAKEPDRIEFTGAGFHAGDERSMSDYYSYDYKRAGRDMTWAQEYVEALINTGDFVLVGTGVDDYRDVNGPIRNYYALAYTGEGDIDPIWDGDDDEIMWPDKATAPAYHVMVQIAQRFISPQFSQDEVAVFIRVSPSLIYEERYDY